MNKADILHLASLARIKITAAEAETLQADIESVLEYVSMVNDMSDDTHEEKTVGAVYNVFREDVVTNESGGETETLLAEAPSRHGNYVAVKKILNVE